MVDDCKNFRNDIEQKNNRYRACQNFERKGKPLVTNNAYYGCSAKDKPIYDNDNNHYINIGIRAKHSRSDMGQ